MVSLVIRLFPPQTVRAVVLTGVAMVGFILSLVANSGCDFMKVHVDGSDETLLWVGLFSYTEMLRYPTCFRSKSYNSLLNGSQKFAKACGVFGALLGGVSVLLLLSNICLAVVPRQWMVAGRLLLVAGTCQCFTFLMLNSGEHCRGGSITLRDGTSHNMNCTLGSGGIVSIFATLLYFGCGAVVGRVLPPPESPVFNISLFRSRGEPDDECPVKEGESSSLPNSDVQVSAAMDPYSGNADLRRREAGDGSFIAETEPQEKPSVLPPPVLSAGADTVPTDGTPTTAVDQEQQQNWATAGNKEGKFV